MLPHPRRQPDYAASNHFSFSSPVTDHLDYGTWAENLKTIDNCFGKRDPNHKFGPWTRTIRLHSSAAGDVSYDASSPPLWKSESPESHPHISRAQTIANYRQEMMDLVHNLPETAFELSLRDIVESSVTHRREGEEDEEAALTERWEMRKGKGKMRLRRCSTSGSVDSGGLLLKLFMPSIPAMLGGGRKISPRLMAASSDEDGSNGSYQARSSSNGSSDSCSSGRGKQRWKLGCYSFFYRPRRSRSMEF